MNRGTEALIEQDGSEGSEVIDDPDVSYGSDLGSDADSDADSDDWGDSTEGSGWFADPSVEGQERYYDGHEWTLETRPVDSGVDPDSDADSDDWSDSTEGSGWFADPGVEGQERYYDGHEWTSETRPVDSGLDADSDADADADSDDWSDSTEGSGWFADPSVEGQERYYDGHEWTSETRLIDSGGPESHLPDHAGELQRALAAATDDIDEVEDRLGNLFERIEHREERGGRAAKKKKADREDDRHVAEARADDDEDYDEDEDEVWLREGDDSADAEAEAAPYLHVAEAADVDEVDDEDEEWLLDDDEDVDGAAGAAPDLHVAEAPANDDEDEEWLLDDADDGVDWQAGAGQILDGDDDDALAELDEALASEEPEKLKRGLFRRS